MINSEHRSYFNRYYRDYAAQNPLKKLEFYLDIIRRNSGDFRFLFEIGFGKGLFLKHAASAGFNVCGCDIDSEAILKTKALLPDIRLFKGEFQSVDIKKFQIIVAFDVVEHISNVRALFKSVFDRLEPGGVFLFICPVYDGPQGVVTRTLDRDETHLHKESRFWWLKLAEESGFRIVKWTGVFRYLLPWKKMLHYEMKGVLKFTSPAISVVCKK
ncbi:class I SAM-dependent methyltransferase [bacterium]|nr:class I SAM-dependent methyltransferase [bacterium]MBU3956313.1 class I SAM-dependent methyltransferase [bacterium]